MLMLLETDVIAIPNGGGIRRGEKDSNPMRNGYGKGHGWSWIDAFDLVDASFLHEKRGVQRWFDVWIAESDRTTPFQCKQIEIEEQEGR